jgi:hypothetical protein
VWLLCGWLCGCLTVVWLRERISDDAMVRLLDQVGGEAQGHRPTITVGAGIMWGSGVAVWLCG